MKKDVRVREILRRLRGRFPTPKTALHHSNPFELLVATILSAQATDSHVNRVTTGLFSKYRHAEDYASVPLEELRHDISSVNFYRTKARYIQATARTIIDQFGGNVPRKMMDLLTLPGVARKTANVVLSNAFGVNEGIAVDTHVKRLAQRLGLTRNRDPIKIEADLMMITPRPDWGLLTHYLILHGRTVCRARNPNHDQCLLQDLCPSRDL